jgi:hypothetical protein
MDSAKSQARANELDTFYVANNIKETLSYYQTLLHTLWALWPDYFPQTFEEIIAADKDKSILLIGDFYRASDNEELLTTLPTNEK